MPTFCLRVMSLLATVTAATGAISCLVSAPRARAADADDIYFAAYAGPRFNAPYQIMSGGIAGYTIVDGLGVGFLYDQVFTPGTRTLQPDEARDEGAALGLEGRWFLEPFELAGALGPIWSSDNVTRVWMSLSGDYLYAVTPSLAARAEIKARYVFAHGTNLGDTHVFVNLGLRLLY